MKKEFVLYRLVELKEGHFEADSIAMNVPENKYTEELTDHDFIAEGTLVYAGRKEKVRVCFNTKVAQTLESAISSDWEGYTVYSL